MINGVLLLILCGIGCWAYCVRKSPDAMRALAAKLLACADADEQRVKYHAERVEAYRRHLGIEQ